MSIWGLKSPPTNRPTLIYKPASGRIIFFFVDTKKPEAYYGMYICELNVFESSLSSANLPYVEIESSLMIIPLRTMYNCLYITS